MKLHTRTIISAATLLLVVSTTAQSDISAVSSSWASVIISALQSAFCWIPWINSSSFCQDPAPNPCDSNNECVCENAGVRDCSCDLGGQACRCIACPSDCTGVLKCPKACSAGSPVFCDAVTNPVFRNFVAGDLQELLATEEIEEIAKDTAGNLDGSFTLFETPMLTSHEKETLKSYADSKLAKALAVADTKLQARHNRDYSTYLNQTILESLLDPSSYNGLYKAFSEHDASYTIKLMIIRRTANNGQNHVKFHTDPQASTMEIWLNDPEELNTGLAILNRDGVVVTNTTSGLVHSENVIHGVPSFTGIRYALFLIGTKNEKKPAPASTVPPLLPFQSEL